MKQALISRSRKGGSPHLEVFFVIPGDVGREHFELRDAEYHHACHVLRHGVGDWITAVDGHGREVQGPITHVGRQSCTAHIERVRLGPREPLWTVTLLQGVLKGTRFRTLVEKATEIGVHRIIPVETAHGVAEASRSTVDGWRRVALAAMKQSGRARLPAVDAVRPLADALAEVSGAQIKLVAHPVREPDSGMPALDRVEVVSAGPQTRTAAILVGPEGGLSDDDLGQAREAGFRALFLGERRLRSETAGQVALTILLHATGDL